MTHAMRLTRRAALAGIGAALAAPRLAHAFPERTLRIIVPWNPGAFADVATRAIAQEMARSLGQSVVVENRAGANGGVGADAAARAAPDGHVLFVANADTHAINPFAYRRLPYDPVADFAPVSMFAKVPFALVAGPSMAGVTDLAGFIAAARAKPGQVTYASWGVASASHLTMEKLIKAQGLQMLHVPFTGQAPGITAVMGGQVDAMFLTAGGAEAAAKDGRTKLIAVSATRRIALLPQTPTLVERGVEVEGGNWFAIMGPARMPEPAVRRVGAAVAEAVRAPSVVELFRVQAAEVETSTPEALRSFIAEDRSRWGSVIQGLGIQLE
jgi:tripartite-type tricarboxylate transporter receptor subunit TctC